MTTAVVAHAENSSDLLSGKIEPQGSRKWCFSDKCCRHKFSAGCFNWIGVNWLDFSVARYLNTAKINSISVDSIKSLTSMKRQSNSAFLLSLIILQAKRALTTLKWSRYDAALEIRRKNEKIMVNVHVGHTITNMLFHAWASATSEKRMYKACITSALFNMQICDVLVVVIVVQDSGLTFCAVVIGQRVLDSCLSDLWFISFKFHP